VANIAIVSVTLLTLLFFVVVGLPLISRAHLTPFFPSVAGHGSPLSHLFHASALMFVAYTGYGRIATLGEEVHEPHRTIPRAIVFTLLVTMILYVAVAVTGVGTVGAAVLSGAAHGAQAAPLAAAARFFSVPFAPQILAIGAITAMLGVLLNLILGLSRVLLAMGRRRDMPSIFAQLNQAQTTPVWSVLMMGAVIAGLVLIGNIKTTWTFSAFTVLIYYALTNLSALRLSQKERLFPAWISVLGLVFCLFLAFWVDTQTWIIGLVLLAAGLAWHTIAQWRRKSTFGE